MKLTPAILLCLTLPAFAQTKTVHHTATRKPVAKTADSCGADAPMALPAAIPKITGCAKPLYALRYTDFVVGTGTAVSPRKWLTVNYTGYLTDGTKFDTSVGKEPITFPYGAHQVIPGWDTGFEGMNIGGKRRLYIPYELAYGETGRPPVIPAKAALVFDVELLAISDNPPAPKTPPAPPAGSTPPPTGSAPAGSTDKPIVPQTTTPPGQVAPPPATKPVTPTTDPTKPTATTPKP